MNSDDKTNLIYAENLRKAIETLSLLNISGEHARIIILMVLLSFCQRTDIVRPALFLVVNEQTDIVAIRLAISILFAERIYARTLTQTSLLHLFSRNQTDVEQDTVLLDLTCMSPGLIPYIKQLSKIRGIPRNYIALMRQDRLSDAVIYGGFVGILSEDI